MIPQEYFKWEAQQELRHEYFDGEVFASGEYLLDMEIVRTLARILPCLN